MPFVQRNWKGEITGLFARPQSDEANEELPEDNPEVLAYLAKHPVPPELLKPPTKEERERFAKEYRENELEHQRIRDNLAQFYYTFSTLETALSALLYAILNLRDSQIAYAIYYSPTSIDARAEMVHNAVIQIAAERKPLADLLPLWETIYRKTQRVRTLRNAVAHSSQITYGIKNKLYARLSPPAFDVIRVGRKQAQRQIPGLTSNDLWEGIRKIRWLTERVDDVNRLVTEFHDGNPSLLEKYRALEAGLRTDYRPAESVKPKPKS
jgi:hypothetical protein